MLPNKFFEFAVLKLGFSLEHSEVRASLSFETLFNTFVAGIDYLVPRRAVENTTTNRTSHRAIYTSILGCKWDGVKSFQHAN
jgi:hypothetical protein